MNLWLLDGREPVDGADVEVIVESFSIITQQSTAPHEPCRSCSELVAPPLNPRRYPVADLRLAPANGSGRQRDPPRELPPAFQAIQGGEA
jgi:hypothetical protein